MNWKGILGATLLAICSTGWSAAEDKIEGNDVFSNPKKEIEFGKLKYLKKSDTIIIPTVFVKLQNWGTQGAVAQTRGSGATQTAQARSTLSVAVDPNVAQTLATSLHKDLVEKMRAAGWNVLTTEDIQDSKSFKKLKWEKDGELGRGITSEKADGKVLGVGAAGGSGAGYYIAVPEGQQILNYGITGPAWAMRKVAKEHDANLFIPTYTINTLYFQAEGDTSVFGNRASASVDSGALVSLDNVSVIYLNPKLAGSGMSLKEDGRWRNNGVTGGTVVKASDTSPAAANALGAAFRALGGAGIQRNSSEYVVETNEAELQAEALRLGQGYNDIAARASALYKGK